MPDIRLSPSNHTFPVFRPRHSSHQAPSDQLYKVYRMLNTTQSTVPTVSPNSEIFPDFLTGTMDRPSAPIANTGFPDPLSFNSAPASVDPTALHAISANQAEAQVQQHTILARMLSTAARSAPDQSTCNLLSRISEAYSQLAVQWAEEEEHRDAEWCSEFTNMIMQNPRGAADVYRAIEGNQATAPLTDLRSSVVSDPSLGVATGTDLDFKSNTLGLYPLEPDTLLSFAAPEFRTPYQPDIGYQQNRTTLSALTHERSALALLAAVKNQQERHAEAVLSATVTSLQTLTDANKIRESLGNYGSAVEAKVHSARNWEDCLAEVRHLDDPATDEGQRRIAMRPLLDSLQGVCDTFNEGGLVF